MKKRILCLDMDAFFASVEQASRPQLKKCPMAVVGKGERTVILSASYNARKKGVRTGQSLKEAKQIYPQLVAIQASNKKYTYISSKIGEFLRTITPNTRIYSVDEAFVDISDLDISSEDIAYRIKSWLKEQFKITGSVGIGESYLLAKMASDVRKPDGFYEVHPKERLTFIDGFKLKDIWGIGRRTTVKLNSIGLFTPKDVRNYGSEKLSQKMGLTGEAIYLACCGLDKNSSPIRKESDPIKSISHSITSPKDIYKFNEAMAYLLQLSEMVSNRARSKGYAGKVITLIIKDTEMRSVTFRKSIEYYTSATHHIYAEAKELFMRNHSIQTVPIRLIGVALSNLMPGVVLNNLEDNLLGAEERFQLLYKTIDSINEKYTDGIIRGSVLNIGYRRQQVISPAFDPEAIYE